MSKEDREIGRWALGERIKRKHPKRPLPRWFDRNDVEMVARCVAAIEGDRATKEQTQREAIAGAFCASKEGPPTARFIWGKLDHFFEHVERGQKKLRNETLEAQHRQREREEDERARSLWRAGMSAAGAQAVHNPPSRAELAKTREEFEEMAAQAAPEFRGVLENMVARYRDLEAKARE